MPKSTEYAAKVADDRGFIAYDAEEDAVWRDLMAQQLPAVRDRMASPYLRGLDLLDLPRLATPEPEKLFSWWSYRAADFRKSNRGLRLDHIWTSPGLTPAVVADTARIHDDVREWDRPSDHAPVTVVYE